MVGTTAEPRFFQQSLPGSLILASFFVVTLPLALLIHPNGSELLLWGYVWLFGMTHFVLTFSIYFNRANLRHFRATWTNRVVYFILPLFVFLIFDLFHALRIRDQFPTFAIFFLAGVRLLD